MPLLRQHRSSRSKFARHGRMDHSHAFGGTSNGGERAPGRPLVLAVVASPTFLALAVFVHPAVGDETGRYRSGLQVLMYQPYYLGHVHV